MMLDDHDLRHLANWLDRYVHSSEREEVTNGILSLLVDDPDLLNGRSWDELRRLAESRVH